MILTVHNLADNYKCLPSEILSRATTFDLYVLDIHTKWIKYQHEQRESESTGRSTRSARLDSKLSVEEMQAMMARVRSEQ
jgi:hypothetical protein